MIDQKEYDEVFMKDNRNLRGGQKDPKRRLNFKDEAKRAHQIQKRQKQKNNNQMESQNSSEGQIEKIKKYGNGKPERVQKPVEIYVDESPEKKTTKKRQAKNRKN